MNVVRLSLVVCVLGGSSCSNGLQSLQTLQRGALNAAAEPASLLGVSEASYPKIALSQAHRRAIGQKIWNNESGGTVNGLTAWNAGEEFPSLGIGHFIWYPKGFQGRFTESFPLFVRYAQSRGVRVPAVARASACPWASRSAFLRDFNGASLKGLRQWLASTVELQTDFIIHQSQGVLKKMEGVTPGAQRQRLRQNYERVATTSNGMYALIDYVNFKGDGTNPQERYAGQGWGLRQVLLQMHSTSGGQPAAREFARTAKRVLSQRIVNSPSQRGEKRWEAGWHNRCNTYARPL